MRQAMVLARRLQWLPPTLARLALGVVFLTSGWGKLSNLDQVGAFFAELGLPAPAFQAILVSLTEVGCGALVLVGLATRLAALPLAVTMVVAIATAQRAHIGGPADLLGLVELAYVVLLAWLATAGAGPVSLDHLVARRRKAS